ncbi:MAG TPA: very short patch repair endonuclease [Armatimonadota bacterium]|jgi:DNA mismatch endonuclease (patch repair protein)
MADVFTTEKRSDVMRKIRSTDTKPEIKLRKALHQLGYRYRLHDKRLPGKPDIVLAKYRTMIQVRGCFWHGHTCHDGHLPKSKLDYWRPKLEGNQMRDQRNDQLARELGWSVIVVWECECTSITRLEETIASIVQSLREKQTSAILHALD